MQLLSAFFLCVLTGYAGDSGFTQNRGQVDPRIQFTAAAPGAQFAFTSEGVRVARLLPKQRAQRFVLRFEGASRAQWSGERKTQHTFTYRVGNDPKRWVDEAPSFDRLIWKSAYPKIDIAFYHSQPDGRMEYDVIVHPGGRLSDVRLHLDHANPAARRIESGDLIVGAEDDSWRHLAPKIFEQTGTERRPVQGQLMSCGKGTYCFSVPHFNPQHDLVIDPILDFATYLGGRGDDEIKFVTQHFVAGTTTSVDFFDAAPNLRTSRDIFVRLSGILPNGAVNSLYGATVIVGGSGDEDLAWARSLDGTGPVDLVGTTASRDFQVHPNASSRFNRYNGGATDAFSMSFVMGTRFQLLSGSLLGGSGADRAHGFVTNGPLSFVVGESNSGDLVASRAIQSRAQGGMDGAVWSLPEFSSQRSTFVSYIGGSGDDHILGAAILDSRLYLVGETSSLNFPNADRERFGETDGFLLELAIPFQPNRPALPSDEPLTVVRSTLIGGAGLDRVQRVFATESDLRLAGETTSGDLEVLNAHQASFGGGVDTFVQHRLTDFRVTYSGFFGGSGEDRLGGFFSSPDAEYILAGSTTSNDLKVHEPLQGTLQGNSDAFIAWFDRAHQPTLVTYYGGDGEDRINSIDLPPNHPLRIGGSTTSSNLEVKKAWQTGSAAGREGFVADIAVPYLSTPQTALVGKGTSRRITWRFGQSVVGVPVTVRISDPSKLRLRNSSGSVVTSTQLTENGLTRISVDGLDDSGESELFVSAPGIGTQTIRLLHTRAVWALRPASVSPVTLYTTTQSFPVQIYLALIDPETGQPTSTNIGIPTDNLVVAPPRLGGDPNIVQVMEGPNILSSSNNYTLVPRRAGSTVLTFPESRFATFPEGGFPITVQPPRLRLRTNPAFAGRAVTTAVDLLSDDGRPVTLVRGKYRIESSDPSLLRVSLLSTVAGVATEEVEFESPRSSTSRLYLFGQANSGRATVRLSSTELAEDLVFEVRLGRTILTPFFRTLPENLDSATWVTRQSFDVGFQAVLEGGTQGVLLFLPPSGGVGAAVEVSDPSLFLRAFSYVALFSSDAANAFQMGNAGSATLRFTPLSDAFVITRELRVNAVTAGPRLADGAATVQLGRGLMRPTSFTFPVQGRYDFTCATDDVAVFTVSPRTGVAPGASASGTAEPTGTCQLHAVADAGESTLRIRADGWPELAVRVRIVPSGFAFDRDTLIANFHLPIPSVALRLYALDENTGLPIEAQFPKPGSPLTANLVAEGGGVGLNLTVCNLQSMGFQGFCVINVSPRSPGDTILRLEQGEGLTTPASRQQLLVRL